MTNLNPSSPLFSFSPLLRVRLTLALALSLAFSGAATLTAQPAAGTTAAVQPNAQPTSFWQNTVNTTLAGGVLVKTDGCDGCADAGATAQKAVGAGGYVDITATETNSNRFVGLTANAGRFFGQTHRHNATSYTDLDFSLYFIIGGYVEVRENGVYRTDTTYGPGDVFRISADATAIRYSKNGEIFHTTEVLTTFPLDVATLIMSRRATVREPFVGSAGTNQ